MILLEAQYHTQRNSAVFTHIPGLSPGLFTSCCVTATMALTFGVLLLSVEGK